MYITHNVTHVSHMTSGGHSSQTVL